MPTPRPPDLTPRGLGLMLETEVGRSQWRGHACSVLVAQIDNFEPVLLGGGDAPEELLQSFLGAFQKQARPGDIVSRTGEAEVSAVLPETDVPEALNLGEIVLSAVQWYFTFSAGIACFPVDAATSPDLLARGRLAMESAIELGVNTVVHLDDHLPGAQGLRAVV